MKKLFSIKYSAMAVNVALLLIRVTIGGLLMRHGYDKLVNFNKFAEHFMDFMGLGAKISLSLVIFAEFFCSLFLILGLLTRLSVLPLIVTMCVVLFTVWHADVFGKGELPAVYLAALLVILMLGPGKISVDGLFGK